MSIQLPYQLYSISDQAVTLDFGGPISLETNNKVHTLVGSLQKNILPGITDIIPAYNSVTVVYDYMAVYQAQLTNENILPVYKIIEDWIEINLSEASIENKDDKKEIIIPVCYDKSVGIDIEFIAKSHQLSIEQVIEIHTSKTYRVFMNGFLPGFAYMGIVDSSIQTPRHEIPRPLVSAGSVGIAGFQTGIYPCDSPGGWQIIGKTPLPLIDENDHLLLTPGSFVKFKSISLLSFEKLIKK
ncbi:MAG: 5-oxoprolinase subunit PxpB [Bacteroidota bacterium]|jgi:inhibitor of KinA